jgi:hypothetical protein
VSLGRHEHSHILGDWLPGPMRLLGMATPSGYHGSCEAADSLRFSPFLAPIMSEPAGPSLNFGGFAKLVQEPDVWRIREGPPCRHAAMRQATAISKPWEKRP